MFNRRRLILAAWRLAASLLAGSLMIRSQPATFQIAGQVVRHIGNHPVRGARVRVAPVEDPNRWLSGITGEHGEFSFSGLPAGKYSLGVNDHGSWQLFQQLDEYSTAIAIGPGLDSQHIRFPLDSSASITGSVLDDAGDPVRGAMVYLFGRSLFRGAYQTGLKRSANTDSDGSFHFAGLAPGTYYVAVSGRPWYAPNGFVVGGMTQNQPAPPAELDVAYPVTYYPNATSAEAATPLKLEEGARAEIQFVLRAVPALHIALDGVEEKPDQQISGQLSQIGPGGTLINVQASITKSGMTGVAPGDYVLSVSLNDPKQSSAIGSQVVSLTGDSSVHLSDAIKTSVSGKVILGGDIPQGLAVLLTNVTNGSRAPGFVAHDGSFDMGYALPAGRYGLLLANTPELYMRDVTVKGGVYSNGVLEVAEGAHIELAITAARGLNKVDGVVLNGNKPVAGAMVLLLAQDLSLRNYVPRDQSDSDGTFTLRWAPPGRYTLLAIDDGRGLEYADPSVMTPYLQRGQVLDLPLSKDATVQVEVQPRK